MSNADKIKGFKNFFNGEYRLMGGLHTFLAAVRAGQFDQTIRDETLHVDDHIMSNVVELFVRVQILRSPLAEDLQQIDATIIGEATDYTIKHCQHTFACENVMPEVVTIFASQLKELLGK